MYHKTLETLKLILTWAVTSYILKGTLQTVSCPNCTLPGKGKRACNHSTWGNWGRRDDVSSRSTCATKWAPGIHNKTLSQKAKETPHKPPKHGGILTSESNQQRTLRTTGKNMKSREPRKARAIYNRRENNNLKIIELKRSRERQNPGIVSEWKISLLLESQKSWKNLVLPTL